MGLQSFEVDVEPDPIAFALHRQWGAPAGFQVPPFHLSPVRRNLEGDPGREGVPVGIGKEKQIFVCGLSSLRQYRRTVLLVRLNNHVRRKDPVEQIVQHTRTAVFFDGTTRANEVEVSPLNEMYAQFVADIVPPHSTRLHIGQAGGKPRQPMDPPGCLRSEAGRDR